MNRNGGFTFLEVIIVLSIVVILSTMGIAFYTNYNKSIEIESLSKIMVSDLKQVQSKSMMGSGGLKWGIHFVNGTTDYYEIFSTPTDYSNGSKVIISTNYLSDKISFSIPAASSTRDIIFNKISGGTTETSIAITFGSITKTINISSLGSFSIQ